MLDTAYNKILQAVPKMICAAMPLTNAAGVGSSSSIRLVPRHAMQDTHHCSLNYVDMSQNGLRTRIDLKPDHEVGDAAVEGGLDEQVGYLHHHLP